MVVRGVGGGRGVGAGSGNPATTRQSLYNESLGGGRAIKSQERGGRGQKRKGWGVGWGRGQVANGGQVGG